MQAQNVMAILAEGPALRDAAQRLTSDVNEACLAVHQVMLRALSREKLSDPEALRRALSRFVEPHAE